MICFSDHPDRDPVATIEPAKLEGPCPCNRSFTVHVNNVGGFFRLDFYCDFGDGEKEQKPGSVSEAYSSATFSHMYTTPGKHNIKVTVFDQNSGAELATAKATCVIKEESCELMIIQPLVHGSGRIAKLIGSR